MKKVIAVTVILSAAIISKAQTEPTEAMKKNPNIVVLPGDLEIDRSEAVDYATTGTSSADWKITLCNPVPTDGDPQFKAGAPNTSFKFIPYKNTYVIAKCSFQPAKYPNVTQVDIRCYRELANGKHEFAAQQRLMMSAYKNIKEAELSVQKPGSYEVQVIDFHTKQLLYTTKFVTKP